MRNRDHLRDPIDALPRDEFRALLDFLLRGDTISADLRARMEDGSISLREVAPLVLQLHEVIYRKEYQADREKAEIERKKEIEVFKAQFLLRFQVWLARNPSSTLDDARAALASCIDDLPLFVEPQEEEHRVKYFREDEVSVIFEYVGVRYGVVVGDSSNSKICTAAYTKVPGRDMCWVLQKF